METKNNISIIVAISENNVIGNGLDIPWKIPGEQVRFKKLTMNKTIIMGRKTFDSIGKALPNRKTIVISKNKNLYLENCTVVDSIEKAIKLTKNEDEIFIAGGSAIYNEFLPLTNTIYLTIVKKKIKGNIYFPKISDDFIEIFSENHDGIIPYAYKTYKRK
jgi:dihydrofolate reductase